MDIIDSKDARKFLAKGVVTPDHVIRIKPKILLILTIVNQFPR